MARLKASSLVGSWVLPSRLEVLRHLDFQVEERIFSGFKPGQEFFLQKG